MVSRFFSLVDTVLDVSVSYLLKAILDLNEVFFWEKLSLQIWALFDSLAVFQYRWLRMAA
jgi:hypothetical protein